MLILMLISITFSFTIYNMAGNELGTRFEHFQNNFQSPRELLPPQITDRTFREAELSDAKSNMALSLLYVNIIILVVGGFGSYLMARRSLKPIEKAHDDESRFTSDASHELRTPLAAMKTEIEVVLHDKNATTGDLRDVLNSNLEEIDKLSSLAEMLLDISRLDNSDLEICKVDLVLITRNIIDDMKLKSDRIIVKSNKKVPAVGNPAALSDLVKVLVENSVQYSPNDSQIIISLSSDDRRLKFEIINAGEGINAEQISHIFDRFYRVDQSRTGGSNKGYGLGLSLAKKIIELHNGELSAESIPGETTTFSFTIPIKKIS